MSNTPRHQMASLLEERKRLSERMHEVCDRAKREQRDPDPSERAELGRLEERIAEAGRAHDAWRDEVERERDAEEARRPFEHVVRPPFDSRREDVRADDAELRAVLRGEKRGLDIQAKQSRDYLAGTAPGSVLVPTTLRDQIYYFLSQFSAVRRTRITILTTSSGEPLTVPRLTSFGTAVLVGEGSALPESSPYTDAVTLNAWKYAQLLQMSTEFVEDTAIDVTGFVAKQGAQALVNGEGTDLLYGSGTNRPKGILVGAGTAVTSQALATGVPSYANLVDLVYAPGSAPYRQLGGEWLASDSWVGSIRKMTDTTGQPLWQPSTIAGQPDNLLGYPLHVDSFMNAVGTAAGTPAAFGDFSGAFLRDVGIRIESSRDYAFANDLVTWRIIQRIDSELVDPFAIKIIKSPTT